MKFEFKPSDYSLGFREYLNYLNITSPISTIYMKTIIPACYIFVFTLITHLLSSIFSVYFTSTIYTFLIIIAFFILILLLTGLVVLLIIKRSKKKRLKNNMMFCDMESTLYFTIEDSYLMRENEFTSIKIKLNEINNIKLLKNGLILSIENAKISVFIPKEALPISLEEFISLLRSENNSIIVLDEFKRFKKKTKKFYTIIAFTILLCFISSFFIAKYSFKRYSFIPNSDLIEQNDNTYLYENEDIGISLTFPSNWENKFGIEENPDGINVYYLADGKQSHNTTLLFSIRGLDYFFDNLTLNIIRNDGLYLFVGPTKISLINGSKEYLEYMELYKDIEKIKLNRNKYYHF